MDKKSISIFRKYYIPYKQEGEPTAPEWEYGISTGALVPKETISHDEMISEVKQLSERISVEDCAKAFLYSLSSGDMRYRTAISSILWAKALPVHKFHAYQPTAYTPCTCGEGGGAGRNLLLSAGRLAGKGWREL